MDEWMDRNLKINYKEKYYNILSCEADFCCVLLHTLQTVKKLKIIKKMNVSKNDYVGYYIIPIVICYMFLFPILKMFSS